MMLYYIQYIKRKHNKFNFPLLNSKGHEVILNHRIKNFFEIMKLEEIKKAELLDERWNINHVVE